MAAVLRSLRLMLQRGPGNDRAQYFEAMRAMLFYIDEVPERQHHPKESELLFPPVMRRAPDLAKTLQQLEHEHEGGEKAVRELQHLLLAWDLIGESRRDTFTKAANDYITFYLEHMRLEETLILPAALQHCTPEDWAAIDAAFATNHDPLSKGATPDSEYTRLFSHIVHTAPSPIGLGDSA